MDGWMDGWMNGWTGGRTDGLHTARHRHHRPLIACKEGRKEMFYLTMHSTHFIYGYMASDIWLRTILIVRKEICCRHIGYSFWLAARVLLYAPPHRQDSTCHGLCYTSHGALAGTRNIACKRKQLLLTLVCYVFLNEWMNEWVSEWVRQWMTELINEWENEWMSEWVRQWMNERMNEWMREWMNEWMNDETPAQQ